jgi:GR25 family glycosyltransferase involved in LPS biosynthesis
MLASHSQVIILEDDIVVSPNFLEYMNDGLEIYKNDVKTMTPTKVIIQTNFLLLTTKITSSL